MLGGIIIREFNIKGSWNNDGKGIILIIIMFDEIIMSR